LGGDQITINGDLNINDYNYNDIDLDNDLASLAEQSPGNSPRGEVYYEY
jgi:hypothetical protein